MLAIIKELLQCPNCSGELKWSKISTRNSIYIIQADIICITCSKQFFVEDEIGFFLTNLDRNDLWAQAESGISKYLQNNPRIKEQLMNTPLNSLHPTDLFIRASILEDQGNYDESEVLYQLSQNKIYTKEYIECSNQQIKFISNLVIPENTIILDIASGKGHLAFQILEKKPNHLIISDFSSIIIRKNKKKLEHKGLLDKATLMVFDARKTPFKNNSINLMTSFLGLGNIENIIGLLPELQRILQGDFYSIMFFFQESDVNHIKFILKNNLSLLNILSKALEEFKKAKFSVELLNKCSSFCKPTPMGEILNIKLDSLPQHETTIDWLIVHAK